MTLNIRVSGSVWSSLIFDNVRQQGDKEGFLIGEVSMQELTNISDSQINKTTRETSINVISHIICPRPFCFYNRMGQIDPQKLEALLKSNSDNVVGWFRCRSGSIPEPSLREITLHHHLRDVLGAHHQTFLFGIFGEGSNINHTTITYYYNFYTYNNGVFCPQKVAIENLGDTAQSEYKHGSSLNTESNGSDSYRHILTSHKKDIIDKDGYLQGMQGIKKTNEAVHDKMKSLKNDVVESEESVKRLVTEVKMLNQKLIQTKKSELQAETRREESPSTPPVMQKAPSNVNQNPAESKEQFDHKQTTDSTRIAEKTPMELGSKSNKADADPFSDLCMDMKASLSSPVKPRSNSDQQRKQTNGHDKFKLDGGDRKLRSHSGSYVPPSSSPRIDPDQSFLQDSPSAALEDKSESESQESTQLPDSPRGLEPSDSQTF